MFLVAALPSDLNKRLALDVVTWVFMWVLVVLACGGGFLFLLGLVGQA